MQFIVGLHTPVSRHATADEIRGRWPDASVREVDDWQEIEARSVGYGRETVVLMGLHIHGLSEWDQLARWRLDHEDVRLVLVLQNFSARITNNALSVCPTAIISDDFSMSDLISTLGLVTRGVHVFQVERAPLRNRDNCT